MAKTENQTIPIRLNLTASEVDNALALIQAAAPNVADFDSSAAMVDLSRKIAGQAAAQIEAFEAAGDQDPEPDDDELVDQSPGGSA